MTRLTTLQIRMKRYRSSPDRAGGGFSDRSARSLQWPRQKQSAATFLPGTEHRGAPKRRTLSIRWIFCPIAYPSSAYAAGTWRKIVSSRPNGTAACRQKVVAPSGIFCPALRNPVGKIRRTYSLFGICAPVRMTSWTCRYSVIPSCPAHLLILLFGNKAF